MSNKSCAVPTPEQRMFLEFRETTEKAMLEAIYSAIDHAAAEMADKVQTAGLDIPATDRDYFTFAAQQVLLVRLCGGDPDSLEGGDPEIGNRLVRNYQHIIDHYWRGNTAPSGGGES